VSVPGTASARTFRAAGAGCGAVDASTFAAPPEEPAAGGAAVDRAGAVFSATPPAGGGGSHFGCTPSPTALCLLGDRFRVEATWRNPRDGTSWSARAVPLLDRSGLFSFFDRGNPEVAVKLLDGGGVNGAFWLFDGRLTDLEYELAVTDISSGERRTYRRPAASLCGGADLDAFTNR